MGIAQIRESRRVPAKLGGRVIYRGGQFGPQHGTIVGVEGGYLKIRLDGQKNALPYHPTYKLDYLNLDGTLALSTD